jgi:hypothetical protein
VALSDIGGCFEKLVRNFLRIMALRHQVRLPKSASKGKQLVADIRFLLEINHTLKRRADRPLLAQSV